MNKHYFAIKIFIFAFIICMIFTAFSGCENQLGGSAYDIAVKNGFEGTEADWLESLKGKDGTNASISIEDIYQSAKTSGYEGSYLDFLKEYLSEVTMADTQYAVNKALLSTVSITATHIKTVSYGNFWGSITQRDEEYQAAGSGVIYQLEKDLGNAYVITNFHVIYDIDSKTSNHISDDISIYLYGQEYANYAIPATYLGGSMQYDIAVLKINNSSVLKASQAYAARIGDSNATNVGETVFAIGNPEAEGLSATKGIISVDSEYITMTAADNTTQVEFRVMRIDAGVNGGNSGGGLFNAKGELIGIVNAKVVDTEIESMSYAIPTAIVKSIADKIISDGKVTKAVLGINITATHSQAIFDSSTGLTAIKEIVTVESLTATSSVKNKLQQGDIITQIKINGTTYNINRTFMLIDLFLSCKQNDTVTIYFTRNGTAKSTEIALDANLMVTVN